MTMRIGFCRGLPLLAGCAAHPTSTASQAPVPALQPNMARVWVLRQPTAPGGNVAAADPMVIPMARRLLKARRDPSPSTISSREPTASRCSLTEPLPTSLVQAVPNWPMDPTAMGASFAVLDDVAGGTLRTCQKITELTFD